MPINPSIPSDINDLNDSIVVVSGLPRSGTSMMMNMLQAGGLPLLTDGIRGSDDDNPKGYFEFEQVKRLGEEDFTWLPKACGKVVKIISYLLSKLPNDYSFRVIFMQRKLSEIIASQRTMLLHQGEDPDKVSEAELKVILEKHLKGIDEWMAQQSHIQSIKIDYNQILLNPDPYIQQVNSFVGGKLDVDEMAQVVDLRLYRQRE